MKLRMIHNPEDSTLLGLFRIFLGAALLFPAFEALMVAITNPRGSNYSISAAYGLARLIELVYWTALIIPSSMFAAGLYNLMVMPRSLYPLARKSNIAIIWITLFPVMFLAGKAVNNLLAIILY